MPFITKLRRLLRARRRRKAEKSNEDSSLLREDRQGGIGRGRSTSAPTTVTTYVNPRLDKKCAMHEEILKWGRSRFPPEILRLIFEHALALDLHKNEDIESSPFPYSVSAACYQLDEVLSDYPEAWTRVCVYLEEEDPATTLKTYLDRSEDLQIEDIVITRKDWKALDALPQAQREKVRCDPQEATKVKSLLPVLYENASRCRNLTIRTLSGHSLPRILDFFLVADGKRDALIVRLQSLVQKPIGCGSKLTSPSDPSVGSL
ncbi:hypothetical protein MD484_g1494, partial [Candolleomyces efflorescens]